MKEQLPKISIALVIAIELGIGLVGLGLLRLQGRHPAEFFALDFKYWLLGVWSVVPIFGLMAYILSGNHRLALEIRQFLVEVIWPLFEHLPWPGLLLVSLAAGLGEELLFRGAIQLWLIDRISLVPAIFITGLIFGLLHAMRPWYFLTASLIGWYLGWLMVASGTLLVPILSHAVYNFIMMLWIKRLAAVENQECENRPHEGT